MALFHTSNMPRASSVDLRPWAPKAPSITARKQSTAAIRNSKSDILLTRECDESPTAFLNRSSPTVDSCESFSHKKSFQPLQWPLRRENSARVRVSTDMHRGLRRH